MTKPHDSSTTGESSDASHTDSANTQSNETEDLHGGGPETLSEALLIIIQRLPRGALFPLGQVVATPGAIDLLDRAGVNAGQLLNRHQHGDWGTVCAEDADTNNEALKYDSRVLSAYELGTEKERIWIITEHDRSVTTLLLPREY